MKKVNKMRIILFIIYVFGLILSVEAHEVRPAYLGINQINDSTYQVVWKIPALGEKIPKINPIFSSNCAIRKESGELLPGAVIEKWSLVTKENLQGNRISIDGLSRTIIDVLINIDFQNGEHYSRIVKPNEPFYDIPKEPSNWEVIESYTVLGIDHILLGIDHLLFVLALVFVTKGKWKIVKTVTAFTIAHSITLSLAALDLVKIPIPPVEAIIALSIVFLAREIMLYDENNPSLAYRQPWIVAFAFGLLHGFGFASALSETGLPQSAIPMALAFFNVGVELGQIAFVIVVLLFGLLLDQLRIELPGYIRKAPVYLIGGVASFWLIERVVGFF
ncbi:MAG: HupE/UreJ family protein [Reichenbachiella sp.]